MENLNNLTDEQLVESLNKKFTELKKEIKKVIVGQDKVIEQILISILAKGHCLLVGVPGLAKTLMVKTLSELFQLNFNRIQFTPDLMPSDITGTEIFEESETGGKKFKFVKGPIFSNMILADEINRTPPKTQSALLEAMQEHKVTAAGITYNLQEPFFVLATQNPIEQEGTYPLPEAQLDRFMFNIWLDYPDFFDEIAMIKMTTGVYTPNVTKIFTGEELLKYQELVRKVPVSDEVIEFTVKKVSLTRPSNPLAPKYIKDYISWGAGPRASQYLILAAKTKAVLDGRFTPGKDDVIIASEPVLRHRLIPNFNAEADNIKVLEIIEKLFKEGI